MSKEMDNISLNDATNAIASNESESPCRRKKIAAKSVLVKSAASFMSSPRADPVSAKSQTPAAMIVADTAAIMTTADLIEDDINGAYDDDNDSLPPARPVVALRSPPIKAKQHAVKSSSKTKVKRNLQRKTSNTKVKAPANGFWEIDGVVAMRRNGAKYEFLVRWKGDYENTWEPQKNLNELALLDAKKLIQLEEEQNNTKHMQ
jgi:Chromo (CHRromatin Organisation MOdifier) domain